MMSTRIVQIYRNILLSLSDREDTQEKFVGWVTLTNELVINLKLLSESNLADSRMSIKKNGQVLQHKCDIESIDEQHYAKGLLYQVALEKNNINNGHDFIICDKWDDVLIYDHYVISPIKTLYFTFSDLYYDESSADKKYQNYLNINKVYEFIEFISKSTKSDSNTIFFNRSYKFRYSLIESDLENNIDIQSLESLMSKDMHREAIIHLMAKEIAGFVKNTDIEQRFRLVVGNLNPLIHNINHSYQSYIDNYSFDKVRKEYNEKRTEYMKKINDNFDAITSKALAIPAGIWFATAQISGSTENSFNLYKNLIVLLTVLIFTIIVILNILGHHRNLATLHKEYSEVFLNLSDRFEKESTKISLISLELDKQKKKVISKMNFTIICSVALVVLTIFLTWQSLTYEIQQKLLNLFYLVG